MPFCPHCGSESADSARFCHVCGAALPGETQANVKTIAVPKDPVSSQVNTGELRKTVTILFCDVTGSTSLGEQLDPESMRRIMQRYFDEISQTIQHHGGTVEKFIGDAVMAAFGIPVLHEDDALRAVRAAAEMRARLRLVNDDLEREWGVRIQARTGVNTGEVVAGDAGSGQLFATGDTVNVAARLEQSAAPGEIVLGDRTLRLVRDAVTVEPLAPLELKGKAQTVQAWRLLEVTPHAPGLARRLDSPLVGRASELAQLGEAFARAEQERSCQLVTILAQAGVGKSRLTQEFLAGVRERARVVQGRCLPYGRGITFWALTEIVKELAAIERFDTPAQARGRIQALLPETDEARLVVDRVAGAIGLGDVNARAEEIFWAVRRFFEELALEGPLVIVFDDIHWAEPTLLDLLEYLASFSREAPLMLLCPARPELAEIRPGWAERENATTISVHPLDAAECEELIDNLLGRAGIAPEPRRTIIEAAEGNPLFVEELLRMLVDDELLRSVNGHWEPTGDLADLAIPASVEALLAARLDRLSPEERAVAQRAAVVGRVFWWGSVVELTPEEERSDVGSHLNALVRKQLIYPDTAEFTGEDAFRFGHILIRDAAYRGLPKESRSQLHERFARWLERKAGDREAEYEEIIGYHLEQAFRCRKDLGPVDDAGLELARHAARQLAPAGRRAYARGDIPATLNLLERARELADDPLRLELAEELGRALFQGGEFERADALLTEVVAAAEAHGDRLRRARALVAREFIRVQTDPVGRTAEIMRVFEETRPVFEEWHDDLGLSRGWRLRSEVDRLACHFGANAESLELALEHARRAGDELEQAQILVWLGTSYCFGPTPVRDAIKRCEELRASGGGLAWVESATLGMLAFLEGMHGNFPEARDLYGRSKRIIEELGMRFALAGRAIIPAAIESFAGDPEAAERELRWGYDLLEEMGERELRSTIAAYLAQVLIEQGRDDEAERYSVFSESFAAADDFGSQVTWRAARAKIWARRGRLAEAEDLAREAVRLAAATDSLDMHGSSLLDLAEVLRIANRPEEAVPIAQDAFWLFEQKDNTVSAGRALALGEALSALS
jgi:predicted ATPase/class 3 adenylate cyclase